mgnify:FL=1|jgi:hypothetical protein
MRVQHSTHRIEDNMTNENDGISKALNVEFDQKENKPTDMVVKVDALPVSKERLEKDLGHDYRRVRNNLQDLIETGQDAVDGILNVARDSDSPRAFEVAGQMIKTLADMNKDLIDLHNKMKVINKEETTINHNTNNSIYVGSTSDLQDLINQSRSAKKALNIESESDDD